jgi:pyridoxal phosphate enzyme (YggS family)
MSRIGAACAQSGRDPGSVRLVGVTKTVPVSWVLEAIDAGLRDVGENYVQEAVAKRAALGRDADRASWHLIGHLQTNKIRPALEAFDIIQSVDSIRLAEAVAKHAAETIPILLEVNAAGEATKSGFAPDQIGSAVKAVQRLPNLDLRGLMTVAPTAPDPETVRPCFRLMRELAGAHGLGELSMGMSGDFEVAIQEGATLVRIGRAIFGERTR